MALLAAVPALGAFPGAPPPDSPYPEGQENPRHNAPDDPSFDRCEAQDPTHNPDGGTCDSYWSEEFRLFGFRPDSAEDQEGEPLEYADCDQLDAQGRDANEKKGDPECSQIAGIRADSAWKFSAGDDEVVIAVFDNGIEWQSLELVDKVHLNTEELPKPQGKASYDANGDGRVSVSDWKDDPRVKQAGGDEEADELLDASDLIAAFSDRTDADGNGYVDDIAGWDFFDDDNDPVDSSACCQDGHGTGRMREAAAETNNGESDPGVCPRCMVMPMRTSDDIVHDTNLIAFATVYAADNGASVTECSCGGLLNSNYARRAFEYADRKGVAQMIILSDTNSANHNYPTTYNETIGVTGSLPDTAPTESCEIPGLFGVPVGGDAPGCKEFLDLIRPTGLEIGLPGQIATTSFFRGANVAQYGGKADIVLVGATGSENGGQAAGAAGLLQSYARERFGEDDPLTGSEIRQLLTMTAEDVLPDNVGSIGLPDKAMRGWDSHFGYGRVNLPAAMRRIQEGTIPPEVQIDGPDWFAPIPVEKVPAGGVPVLGRIRSPHFDGGVTWKLEYACGQDPGPDGFELLESGTGEPNGEIARIPKSVLEDLADDCDGSVPGDAGRPAGRPIQPGGPWPGNPYPEPDPERHAFQLRLTAHETADPDNVGMYRKTLFAYHDDGNLEGWPKPLGPNADREGYITGSGGESSPRLADLDADNRLDLLLATSSGELHVLNANGDPLRFWNDGQPVRTRPYAQADAHGPGGVGGEGPREPLRIPAIGDITGDGDPEVVVTAGEHIYAWQRDGSPLAGFPVRVNPAFSAPCKPGKPQPCFAEADRLRTPDLHVKRGFIASPALADLDEDGALDVVAGALDQYVYVVDGKGKPLSGFPKRIDSEGAGDGAEIVNTPSIADLDGDGDPEIVQATNELIGAENELDPEDILSIFVGNATGANPTYALHGDGKPVAGWPVRTGVLLGDLLPTVLPGHDQPVADVEPTRKGDEVVITGGTGFTKLVGGDGDTLRQFANVPPPAPLSNVSDSSLELSAADYAAVGRLSDRGGLSVVKGGITLLYAANLAATNQNFPFNHVTQAWDPRSGDYRRGWPVATDDLQLLSQPTIAKVGGAGGTRQALVGTGLYQLHAYGADGSEPEGWPKFTGGWIFSTPTVGDIDGNGKLDVITGTREGWEFAWATDVPACEANGTGTNSESWTFHHDEHSTNNYGHDARPPSRPSAPSGTKLDGGDLELSFQGSGDDLFCGEAARYEVAGSDEPITSGADFTRAKRLPVAAASSRRARTAAAGDDVRLTVDGGARFDHFAVRAVDDAGNVSYVSADAGTTAEEPIPTEDEPAEEPLIPTTDDPESGSSLPFTGLTIAGFVLLGLALTVGGIVLRRRYRARLN